MKKLTVLVCCMILISASTVQAQTELKAQQINVFKNGTYYVLKEGDVSLKKGIAKIALPTNPLLGTFWLTSLKDIKIDNVVFRTDTIKKQRPARSLDEFISANLNKAIKITYKVDEKTTKELSGTLQLFVPETSLIKLKGNDGRLYFISANEIKEFSLDDKSNDLMTVDSLMRLGEVEFNKKPDETRLRMVYMQTGIQWMPSYFIKIIDDKELQIEMKALVENYSESIEDADLTLTVGNPQFYWGKMTDPITLGYLSNIFEQKPTAINNTRYQYQNYNAYAAQDISVADGFASIPAFEESSTYTTEGEKTNDLYMYSIGKVSLLKNTKTSFEIFAQKVTYKDVYEVNVSDVVNYITNRYIANDPEARVDVFHSLRLTNKTSNPFTTAPAFVLNEKQQPLAQDIIKYTSVGGDVSVQLSKAGDVVVKNQEEEIKKMENFKKVGRNYYNKVTIKGTISISNQQKKTIDLRIKKSLTAEVLEASDNGKSKKSGKYYSLNPYSDISWEIPIKENEKKTVTYQYDVLVINN
ncbi:MAG: hypothetical protein WCH34_12170 [Bacteroidota bacterium]